jgi:hypothetical protein
MNKQQQQQQTAPAAQTRTAPPVSRLSVRWSLWKNRSRGLPR